MHAEVARDRDGKFDALKRAGLDGNHVRQRDEFDLLRVGCRQLRALPFASGNQKNREDGGEAGDVKQSATAQCLSECARPRAQQRLNVGRHEAIP